MNIEIVGFYKNIDKTRKLYGTLHAYLIDLDIDLRGIPVFRTKKDYIIHLPSLLGMDEDTKENVRYPIFSFTNKEKTQELQKAIKEAGIKFIKENT